MLAFARVSDLLRDGDLGKVNLGGGDVVEVVREDVEGDVGDNFANLTGRKSGSREPVLRQAPCRAFLYSGHR